MHDPQDMATGLRERIAAQKAEEQPRGFAAALIRPTTTVKIGDLTWEIEACPPRRALTILGMLFHMLGGEVVTGLFEGIRGLQISTLVDMDLDRAKEVFVDTVGPKLAQAIAALDPDRLVTIAEALLVGQCTVTSDEMRERIAVDDAATLDTCVRDVWGLLRLVWAAAGISLLPILPAGLMNAAPASGGDKVAPQ